MSDTKKLIIIDGNAIVHRAFHALPPLTNKKGEVVNAVYGFLLFFLKSVREFEPDFVVAAFDFPAPTFRHQKYKLYKANRVKAPDELYAQIPMIKDVLKCFNIQIIEKKGFEADDILGTISKKASRKQVSPVLETILLSSDTDILQLVDKNTKVYNLKKGVKDAVLYGKEEVREKYDGLNPDQLVDYRALRGDPSDNIPGVNGIGEKTAITLLKEFGDLDTIYSEISKNTDRAREIKTGVREKLLACKEQAYVSQMLAQINHDVPIDFDFQESRWGDYDKSKIAQTFEEYGFKTLVKRLSELKDNIPKENNLKLW